jgi:hypothetical protein
LERLVLADREYPPYNAVLDPDDLAHDTWREAEDGIDTLRLVGVKNLAALPANIWTENDYNDRPDRGLHELFLAGLDVGQLLSTQVDFSQLLVLGVSHCDRLPGAVMSKLVGLQQLIIRECRDLDLPAELTGLSDLEVLELCGHGFSDAPPMQRYTDLPPTVLALRGLQDLKLENLASLTALPAT